jgi:heme exporter protein C
MASAPASSLSASLTGLANPTRFMDLSGRVLPWLVALTAVLLLFGLWLAFFVAPADYQQGDTARIMFIHVPSAWLSLLLYTMMAVSALGTLVWHHPLADVAQKAAAPLGAAFAFLCLVTGSLWGKPMWGTFWVWDARLTSMLVLFLMYCGILALWRTIEEPGRAARAVAILTLVGVVNIPIIKFSVDWWNTLHQPAGVLKLSGSAVDASILWPLLEMAVAFTLLALTLHLVGMRTEILRRRVRTLTILAAERAEREAA